MKEESMESTESTTPVANDVLHFENQSKLSAEEIAKAVAHHKHHHGEDQPQGSPAKPAGCARRSCGRSSAPSPRPPPSPCTATPTRSISCWPAARRNWSST